MAATAATASCIAPSVLAVISPHWRHRETLSIHIPLTVNITVLGINADPVKTTSCNDSAEIRAW